MLPPATVQTGWQVLFTTETFAGALARLGQHAFGAVVALETVLVQPVTLSTLLANTVNGTVV